VNGVGSLVQIDSRFLSECHEVVYEGFSGLSVLGNKRFSKEFGVLQRRESVLVGLVWIGFGLSSQKAPH
jgi:hypothetical protein